MHKPIYKTWWFWLIIIILIIIIFGKSSDNNDNNIENINDQTDNSSNISSENSNNTEATTDDTNQETLEDKIKKVLYKYDFDSIQNENDTLTLNASTTGNAQYSISEDVNYMYIHSLAPVVYEDENINNFIFKVTITDDTNKDFSYTYGCSLTREVYFKHNWATTLDSDIYKIFIDEGQVYSN